ncbi:glycerol-3-phosphate dehydrogenase/oxidase [Halalkalibacillus halophilus]|uniref:glycerol-3-phosphate dehydrogenase/oxidase n=1 Tax=Halalkalibacillus halophilus TaxID=392827 RepID=UPI0004272924|nr:glycerol-3-phosphate dehydrogenase/oxidase [Halalkalibacillus halophilus]
MQTFSNKQREQEKDKLSQTYDLIVIGGGITGAGIALDAATRGYQTLLLDMQDFAAGTSSRSTKLVHGGLRYLKNFEVRMVAEVGKERAIVYENGPHITRPEWMMLPFYDSGTFGPISTSIGLRVYDFLAGVKKQERRYMLSKEKTIEQEPLLKEEGLKGSGYYVEYKTDDARLTIEVLKKAVEKGADAFNYMKVSQFLYNNGKVMGVKAEDQITGESYDVYSQTVINAAGPWVDELRDKDRSKKGKELYHTKGVHLVFDGKKFPLRQAVYFDSPDKRMIFAIPRDGKTYVGTTDTHYIDDLKSPTITKEDRQYIIDAIAFMFPKVEITEEDIESTWSGVRPLIYEEGKDPSEISRKDEILISDSGLMSMAGGKLTGYRKMAQQVVDLVAKELKTIGYPVVKSDTKYLALAGGEVGGSSGFAKFTQDMLQISEELPVSKKQLLRWINRYGLNTKQILAYIREKGEEESISNELYGELMYALEYESVYRPVDFFIRRTGALFFDLPWVEDNIEDVLTFMQKYFKWSNEEVSHFRQELLETIKEAKEGSNLG